MSKRTRLALFTLLLTAFTLLLVTDERPLIRALISLISEQHADNARLIMLLRFSLRTLLLIMMVWCLGNESHLNMILTGAIFAMFSLLISWSFPWALLWLPVLLTMMYIGATLWQRREKTPMRSVVAGEDDAPWQP